MANDKNFKIKNGLSAKRYLGGSGTETASTTNYSLTSALYDSKKGFVGSQESVPTDLFFKPDGTKMFVIGQTGDDVNEYNLSTAWDVSTASYSQNFSVANQETTPRGIAFKPDGTKMFILGQIGDDVNEYNLSTAWNVSTASYSQNFSVANQETSPSAIRFNNDGTKMYILGTVTDKVFQYSLSTAYDVSTASYGNVNFSVQAQESTPEAVIFNNDGTKMYILGTITDAVHQYSLSTAFNVSTASYDSVSFSVVRQELNAMGMFFKPDGTKFYVIGYITDYVYQYSTVAHAQALDLSTGSTFSFTLIGPTTVSFTNEPASGKVIAFTVEIIGGLIGYSSTITWPSSVKWEGGIAPTLSTTKELYTLMTIDGGTTYYAKRAAEGLA